MSQLVIAWCERMVNEAANDGRFEDWQNYTELLNLWKRRLLTEVV